MEKIIKIIDESGDKQMLWDTIGKPAYEKGLLEGRQEAGLFAIIPMSILENKILSANAKLLYGEIMALSKKSGLCYATNEYMADMLGLAKRSIPQILKELSGCGLIIIDIKRSKKGTYRDITVSFFNNGGHRCRTMRGFVKERGGASLDNEDKREIDKIEIDKDTVVSEKIASDLEPSKIDNTHLEVRELFDYYKVEFLTKISDTPPIFNWGQCEKIVKLHIKSLGLSKMKQLLDKYFKSDDKLYKDNAYSLSCFLSSKIIHQLNQLK